MAKMFPVVNYDCVREITAQKYEEFGLLKHLLFLLIHVCYICLSTCFSCWSIKLWVNILSDVFYPEILSVNRFYLKIKWYLQSGLSLQDWLTQAEHLCDMCHWYQHHAHIRCRTFVGHTSLMSTWCTYQVQNICVTCVLLISTWCTCEKQCSPSPSSF